MITRQANGEGRKEHGEEVKTNTENNMEDEKRKEIGPRDWLRIDIK